MDVDFKEWKQTRVRPAGRRKIKRGWFLLSGVVLGGLSSVFYFFFLAPRPDSPSSASTDSLQAAPEVRGLQVIEGRVEKRSSLFQSLDGKKVPRRMMDLIVSELKPYLNFRTIKGGTYQLSTDERGQLVKFIYEATPTEIYEVRKEGTGYIAEKIDVPLETQLVKVVGEIRSSLFEAMDAAGEQDALTIAFADVLAWEIDFYKDVREGDRFKVVVEKVYKGKEFIRYGQILAVAYQGSEKQVCGIRYQGEYYNENGTSLKKAFLKSPLRFNRISSRFSRARRHPILGGVRPHLGVDYAAPPGTPVWAVGDGTVALCGRNGGFGKQVVLRHMNGYMTYYGHLTGYGPGIRVGKRVSQKQIVGYVGSTGLSTGPHLDYRLAKDGQFRNPMKESFPKGMPLEKRELQEFQKSRDELIACLQGDVPWERASPPFSGNLEQR